jgi:hypothetical protein
MNIESIELRRKNIRNFLIEYGHLHKKHLIQKAKDKNLYKVSEGNEDVYNSLMNFAKAHDIILRTPKTPDLSQIKKTEFIESLDKDGNAVLKSINDFTNTDNSSLIKILEAEVEKHSKVLLNLNQLIKFYKQ